MSPKPTLYQLLGVQQGASQPQIQAAYRSQVSLLESTRATRSPQEFTDREQLIRVAFNTLADPVTRVSYDAKLAADSAPADSGAVPGAKASRSTAVAVASTQVRAEALSLRADALALRADAMLLRGGLDDKAGGGAAAQAVATALTGLKLFVRAIGLLVVVCIAAFGVTRLMVGDPAARHSALETKAREQTALQEYFQAHGVRPANMAELELLEAERRRREHQTRQGDHDREKQEREARQFDEESRRLANEVSENMRQAQEDARRQAELDRQNEQQKEQQKQYEQRAREEAERMRIEQEKQRWRETLRQ
jgi:curved DNA-binding protein CbpA